ncbi:MAG: DUF5020 family protein [Lentisphaeraceae bacterium]|nr:DUF5020 family protein [Lentisphaeraceae bacterium]
MKILNWLLFISLSFSMSANEKELLTLEQDSSSIFTPKFMDNSISFLHGNDYKFGERDKTIFTFEHFSAWEWGDVFSFADHIIQDHGENITYWEFQPRFSLSYLTGKNMEFGIVKDVLIANEYNANDKGFKAYLAGIGFKLDLSDLGFKHFNLNLYYRNEIGYKGDTYQVTANWNYPIHVSDLKFRITGFVDFAGAEGDKKENLLFVPQIVMDVGDLFNKPNQLYMGVEYSNWNNKFGAKGVNEELFQFLIKYHF